METYDKFIPLGDLVWPITYTWRMSVPWGLAEMSLTVDTPRLVNDPIASAKSVIPLWSAAIAPAISFLTGYMTGSGYLWKLGAAVDGTGTFPVGQNGIFPMGKSHGVAVVMHTGHTDNRARRRLIFPTCPRSWIDELGQLTDDGAGKILTHLRGMFGGLNGTVENAPMRWLIPYADAIRDPITGFYAPGFRDVSWLRLCQYTVPVPDISLGP